MAQIAGRAGRHQRDGTFGSLTLEGDALAEFRPEEIERIEEHRFAPLDFLYWRESELDFRSVEDLIKSLERRPVRREVRAAPEAVDLNVLKLLSTDPEILARATSPERVRRLWAACGLPDFRKTGPEHHSRLVARLYFHLGEGDGRIPQSWYAEQVARLDNVQGDIETLADRIAGVRTWAYIAHRADWLESPENMAERTMAVEEKLSDALHERLTQRFVDRRTAVLMRDVGKGAGEFPVQIDEEGEVSVGTYAIGRLNGFTFEVDPTARHADRKMLLATAERRLGHEYEKRAAALVADKDQHFALRTEAGEPVAICWRGHEVARLGPGKNLLSPRLHLDRRIDRVSEKGREAVILRLKDWLRNGAEAVLGPLRAAGHAAQDPATPPAVRALLALLVDQGGIAARDAVAGALAALDKEQRRAVTRHGVRIGALDLFMPAVLKPEAMRWRAAFRAAAAGRPMPALPAHNAVVLPTPPDRTLLFRLGFRVAGPQMIRVDMAERIAHRAHEARAAAGDEKEPVDPALVTSLGLLPETVAKLMRDIGFRPSEAAPYWVWRGRDRRRRPRTPEKTSIHFAALAGLKRG
jgi:ATP-dependent RNA helicase SUPV3L1/SUV3